MQIKVNDTLIEVYDQISIAQLCEVMKLSELKGIAIAVNDEVVPKSEWHNTTLFSTDNVLIIKAAQGG